MPDVDTPPTAPVTTDPAVSTPAPAATAVTPTPDATPAATTPAPTAATLATGKDPAPTVVAPPQTWPEDWREKVAGEDKGFLNRLKRYGSPDDAFKWLRTMDLRLSSGELKEIKTLPENATPEQVAEFRKDNGIPEEAKGYLDKLALPGGLVPAAGDKSLLDAFASRAHELNWKPEQFNQAVSWYFDMQDRVAGQQQEADRDFEMQATQSLMQAMGGDFKPNMNALASFWNERGGDIRDMILSARTPDGRVLGNIPEVVSHYVALARELNPAAALLPPGAQQNTAGIATRKAEIEKTMYLNGKQNPAYFKNPTLQQEYRDLIAAEERMRQRVA